MVPASNFLFDDDTSNDAGASTDKTSGSTTSESETILYQWGTKTAVRRFCKTCGILPFYIPRSNPDGYAITYHCVDWGEDGPPETKLNTMMVRIGKRVMLQRVLQKRLINRRMLEIERGRTR